MSNLSDKYYSAEQLLEIANKNSIVEEYHKDFILKFESEIQLMNAEVEAGIGDFQNIEESALTAALNYINKFTSELKKGHSLEWAKLYADNIEEHRNAFNEAYDSIKSKNKVQAIEELKIHCKNINADPLYEKHFCFLMEKGGGTALRGPDELATIYSKVFNEQIALGKSKIFCHHYADNIASDYNEAYAYGYATGFDNAIIAGKSEEYATVYAFQLADYYGENYFNSKDIVHDETDEFNLQKITAYMKASEYGKENKIEPLSVFIECFQHEYLNTIYANDGKPLLNEADLDKILIERTLKKIKR